jgi:hypothetical protein
LVDFGPVRVFSSERLAYVVAALLLGCASWSHVPPEDAYRSGPKPNEVEAESVARSWVADNVQNPSSAVVRNVVVVRPYRISGGYPSGYRYGWEIAFEYNPMNSKGEFEGFRRKVAVGFGGKIKPMGLTPDME